MMNFHIFLITESKLKCSGYKIQTKAIYIIYTM